MIKEKARDQEKKILTIAIDERIDSTNATKLGEALEGIRQENPEYRMILDVEEMPYISSAGLRVLLSLRKEQGGLKLVNVSSEIYEILEVTGFSQILDVQKALRKVSIEGCRFIGKGAFGSVYQLDGDTVVKVYHDGASVEEVKQEQEYSKKAFLSGIPTAIPFDIVDCNGCYGLVYELIDAKTLSGTIRENSDNLDEYARKWAELLKALHAAELEKGALIDVKDIFHDWISKSSIYYSEKEIEQMHALIDRIPDRNCIVHGDAHVKNIMMQKDELVLIDMASICVGHPIFDLSGIYMSHMMAGPDCEVTLGLPQEICETMFIKMVHYYFDVPESESIEQILNACASFALLKIALFPVIGESTRAKEVEKEIVAVAREKFFPIIEYLPGDMLSIFDK